MRPSPADEALALLVPRLCHMRNLDPVYNFYNPPTPSADAADAISAGLAAVVTDQLVMHVEENCGQDIQNGEVYQRSSLGRCRILLWPSPPSTYCSTRTSRLNCSSHEGEDVRLGLAALGGRLYVRTPLAPPRPRRLWRQCRRAPSVSSPPAGLGRRLQKDAELVFEVRDGGRLPAKEERLTCSRPPLFVGSTGHRVKRCSYAARRSRIRAVSTWRRSWSTSSTSSSTAASACAFTRARRQTARCRET